MRWQPFKSRLNPMRKRTKISIVNFIMHFAHFKSLDWSLSLVYWELISSRKDTCLFYWMTKFKISVFLFEFLQVNLFFFSECVLSWRLIIRLITQEDLLVLIQNIFFKDMMQRLKNSVRWKTEIFIIFNLILIIQILFRIINYFLKKLSKK